MFVMLGKTRVNTDYISKVEDLDDGTVKVYVDGEPPRTVTGDDAKALLAAITPVSIGAVAEPLVTGGLGGAGLPASAFARQPETPTTDDAPSSEAPTDGPASTKPRPTPKTPAVPAPVVPAAPKAE